MQSWALILGWLLGVMPAQTREAGRLAKVEKMELQRSSDACSALSPAECCAQMLEIAVYRATGDQLPKGAKSSVRLSCNDPDQTIPDNACRLIAMGRGFSARDAAELCTPGTLAKRCSGDDTCKQCMSDLDRLEWKAPQRACYALTYVPKVEAPTGTRIVTLERSKPKSGAADLVRVRRLVMR